MILNELTKYSFKDTIYSDVNKPIIVMFHNNCVKCKIVGPVLEELEKEYDDDVLFYSYETKVEDRITKEFHINKTPHICIFIDGMNMNDFTGIVEKDQLKNYIDSLLSSIY